MIHLDSNVLIGILNGRAPALRTRLDDVLSVGRPLFASILVYHELMFGAAGCQFPEKVQSRTNALLRAARIDLVPFDVADAQHAADIRDHLRRQGRPIGPYDLLIAAQARRCNATLVTANTREFERVPGLTVANWSA